MGFVRRIIQTITQTVNPPAVQVQAPAQTAPAQTAPVADVAAQKKRH